MGFLSDLRHAGRSLVKDPGFTLAAVLTLAVGIGANTAVFGLVNQVLFEAPPFERPDELVLVWNTSGESDARVRVAAPDVALFRERTSSFAGFAFMNRVTDGSIESSAGDGAEHVRIAAVTVGFFDLLGVDAVIGRTFDDQGATAAIFLGKTAG